MNQAAYEMVQRSTSEQTKVEPAEVVIIAQETKPSKYDISRVMAEMGRKGGQIGGKRRLETMTAAQRKRSAIKAAKARWGKTRPNTRP